MGPTIFHKGRRWPVNAEWAAAYIAPWPQLADEPIEAIDAVRQRTLEAANKRRGISPEDRRWLDALDHHFNVRNAIANLGEPDHASFGFTGVDQLHGTAIEKRGTCECGCVLQVIFDHHHNNARAWARDAADSAAVLHRLDNAPALAKSNMAKRHAHHHAGFQHHARLAGVAHLSAEEARELPPAPEHHHRPHFVCEDHAHLANDPAALHAAVMADNAGVAEAVEAAYLEVHAEQAAADADKA